MIEVVVSRYGAQAGADSIEKGMTLERFRNASGNVGPLMGLDDLDLSMYDMAGDLAEAIGDAVSAGWSDTVALTGIDLKTPPAGALAYAKQRAAELVGMKVTSTGALIPNPNAGGKWQISESIREDIKAKVGRAIAEGWSPQDLTAELMQTFGPWRAETIARTETGFAYNEGAIAVYEEGQYELVEVLDGDGCLPLGHDDTAPEYSGGEDGAGLVTAGEQANGQIWRVEDLREYRLGHPNCVRAFIPYEGG